MSADESPTPTDRDVILGEGSDRHKTNLLLQDIMRLNRIVWKLQKKDKPKETADVMPLAESVFKLIKNGKPYELAGLKEVPRPFMKSQGRFIEKTEDGWKEISEEEAKDNLAKAFIVEFAKDDLDELVGASPYKDLEVLINGKTKEQEDNGDDTEEKAAENFPQPKDAILTPVEDTDPTGEKMYDQQVGNKTIFNLASQLVTTNTITSESRVEAALTILQGLEKAELHEEDKSKVSPQLASMSPRFLVRNASADGEANVTWTILDGAATAEFAVIFVFEVFLEKDIEPTLSTGAGDISSSIASLQHSPVPPSTEPVDDPTDHDVLFGRGGLTNMHLGNKRFRDVIALHRPDYIQAIKMDKPAVARKIVKAIRTGDPPGRFLKKGEDGKWYDVGDRTAAEKTSQGLRERTNAEKRQRSALKEALGIRKEDMTEDRPANKKVKQSGKPSTDIASTISTLNYVGTNLAVPLSLNMKDTSKAKKSKDKSGGGTEELSTDDLPPMAVDEEGNIIRTNHDILCGRGGLTNHHMGNKRFRDIVAIHRPDYVKAPKIQKPSVARVIVRAIRNGGGRFLKWDDKAGKYFDIGDKKAAEKTSQALREKTHEDSRPDAATLAGMQALLPNPAAYLAAVTGATIVLPGAQPMVINAAAAEKTKEEGDTKEEDAKEEGAKEEVVTSEEKVENEAEGEAKEVKSGGDAPEAEESKNVETV